MFNQTQISISEILRPGHMSRFKEKCARTNEVRKINTKVVFEEPSSLDRQKEFKFFHINCIGFVPITFSHSSHQMVDYAHKVNT